MWCHNSYEIADLTVVQARNLVRNDHSDVKHPRFEREQCQRVILMRALVTRTIRKTVPAATKDCCCTSCWIVLNLQFVLEDTGASIPYERLEPAEVFITCQWPAHLGISPLLDLEIGLLKIWLTIRIRNVRGRVIHVICRICVVPRTTERMADFRNVRQPATLCGFRHEDKDVEANAATRHEKRVTTATKLVWSCNPEARPREWMLRNLDA